MRKIVAAMRHQEGRGRGLDVDDGACGLLFAGAFRAEESRSHGKTASGAEIIHARHREASADDVLGQAESFLPVTPDGEQRRVMAACRMAAREDSLRVATVLRGALLK